MAICGELNDTRQQLTLGNVLRRLVTWLCNPIRSYTETQRIHTERREMVKILSKLDTRSLRDIGLTHQDILWAASLPVKTDATRELQKLRSWRNRI